MTADEILKTITDSKVLTEIGEMQKQGKKLEDILKAKGFKIDTPATNNVTIAATTGKPALKEDKEISWMDIYKKADEADQNVISIITEILNGGFKQAAHNESIESIEDAANTIKSLGLKSLSFALKSTIDPLERYEKILNDKQHEEDSRDEQLDEILAEMEDAFEIVMDENIKLKQILADKYVNGKVIGEAIDDVEDLLLGAYNRFKSYEVVLGKITEHIDAKKLKALFNKLAKELNINLEQFKPGDIDAMTASKLMDVLFNALPSYKDLSAKILKNLDGETLKSVTKCLMSTPGAGHFRLNTADKEELQESKKDKNMIKTRQIVEAIKKQDLQTASKLLEEEVKERADKMKADAAKEVEDNPCFKFHNEYNNTGLEQVKTLEEAEKKAGKTEEVIAGKPPKCTKCNKEECKCEK
jgi:hypothetical protein